MQTVSSRGQLLVVGLHALLGMAVLVAATTLSALHDPISSTLASLFGIILGLAGAGSAAVSTLGTAVNGKAAIPPALLSEMSSVLSDTVAHLADARKAVDAQRPLLDLPPQPPRQPPAG